MPLEYPIIAIVGGTGKEGKGLAIRWAKAGYPVIIGSRQAEKAMMTAGDINTRLGTSTVIGLENREAAYRAEICVLTVVQSTHREVIEALKDHLRNKIFVDATSRIDFRDPRPPAPPSAAQIAQDLFDASVKVVAAFENVPSKLLTKSIDGPIDADALICSDDLDAAKRVIQLAEAAGMRGYYAGRLENSIIVEGITSVLISMNKHYGVKDASVKVTGISGA